MKKAPKNGALEWNLFCTPFAGRTRGYFFFFGAAFFFAGFLVALFIE